MPNGGGTFFADLLEFCWETGARPQEVVVFEPRHWEPDRGRFVLLPGEAKGKKRFRIVYCTDRATEIVRRPELGLSVAGFVGDLGGVPTVVVAQLGPGAGQRLVHR